MTPGRSSGLAVDHGRSDRCWTPVLIFHRVLAQVERPHDVSWSAFQRLIAELGQCGSQRELARDEDVAAGRIAFTFDDGTIDHLEVAGELANRGLAAIFFVPLTGLGKKGFMTSAHLREVVGLGHELGGHGVSHKPLRPLTRHEVGFEVAESKARLEDLSQSPVRYFAPPGGIGHSELQSALVGKGYLACRMTRWGVYRPENSRWRIPGLPVTETTIRRGWVVRAGDRGVLPLGMRTVWMARSVVPTSLQRVARERFTQSDRRMGLVS